MVPWPGPRLSTLIATVRPIVCAIPMGLSALTPAWAQSAPLVNAPRVEEQIEVRVEQKKVRYALDGRNSYFDLEADHLFLASRPVKVTYPELNPLRIQISAQVSEVADPAHALVGTLL
jgi:hypothetical protein